MSHEVNRSAPQALATVGACQVDGCAVFLRLWGPHADAYEPDAGGGARVELTPDEADEIAMRLREYAAKARKWHDPA
jgi:hypothetical protein